MGYITGEDRGQINLLPNSIDEYITNENPVRVIDAFVESLDMESMEFVRATPKNTGRPGYNPKDLLKLYIYGYMNRIRSSRRLETEAARNLEIIWLLNSLKPDFKTIADFRKDNKTAIKQVFKQFNLLCNDWNLFGKELVAIDGSKFKADNSKKKNFNKQKLDRHLKYIDEKISEYINDLEQNDEKESSDRKPTAEEIKERIEELKNRKNKYETYKEIIKEEKISEISEIDSDARLMSNNNRIEPCYNVQSTVDSKNKLIIDFEVTKNPSDQGQLAKMSIRAKEILEVDKLEVLADKGYYKGTDIVNCIDNNITPYVSKQTISNSTGDTNFYPDKFKYNKEKDEYICPTGQSLKYSRNSTAGNKEKYRVYSNFNACSICEYKDKCTTAKRGREINRWINQDLLDEIDHNTKENKEKYKQRQMIVEHPFGTIKRGLDFYYFLTRGSESVSTEMSMICTSYNLKRVINIMGVQEILKRLAMI